MPINIKGNGKLSKQRKAVVFFGWIIIRCWSFHGNIQFHDFTPHPRFPFPLPSTHPLQHSFPFLYMGVGPIANMRPGCNILVSTSAIPPNPQTRRPNFSSRHYHQFHSWSLGISMDVTVTWIRTPNKLDGPDPRPRLGFLRLISGLVYRRIFSHKQTGCKSFHRDLLQGGTP